MTTPTEPPDYDQDLLEEQEHLDIVISAIHEEIKKQEALMSTPVAHRSTARELGRLLTGRLANFQAALEDPYFGRVDYVPLHGQDKDTLRAYIGKRHVPNVGTYSWQDPIAALFYAPDTNLTTYIPPIGEIPCRIDLRRHLVIRKQEIVVVSDIYRRLLPAGTQTLPASSNPALTEALSSVGTDDNQLRDIVRTIQPDQYQEIANVSDQVLIVQGAAGSGKSQIGLHRIAYLLSPFSDLQGRERPTPETTLFVGPSAAFLEYASNLLPGLDVQNGVEQTTFHAWMSSHLSQPRAFDNRIFRDLLNGTRITASIEGFEAFKGSLAMAEILERFAKDRWRTRRKECSKLSELTTTVRVTVSRRDFLAWFNSTLSSYGDSLPSDVPPEDIIYRTLRSLGGRNPDWVGFDRRGLRSALNRALTTEMGVSNPGIANLRTVDRIIHNLWEHILSQSSTLRRQVTVSKKEVQSALKSALPPTNPKLRLNVARKEFVDRIVATIIERGKQQNLYPRDVPVQQVRSIEAEVVEPWLASFWPYLDFDREYTSLLSDPEYLIKLSGNEVSRELAVALQESVSSNARTAFQDSDAGALGYLDHLLNGTIAARYRHIVVDEAQDISPIEFKLLRLSSANNWFTILGDTAQRLTPYRGIERWRDLQGVLGRSNIKVQQARVSYRSNQHITKFNNRILRIFDKSVGAPIPYGRDGHRVEYRAHDTMEEMFQQIPQELSRVRTLDDLSEAKIAILVRNSNVLTRLRNFCRNQEEDGFGEIQFPDEPNRTGKTIAALISDTKGLEYDAVLVLGVNESFASNTFNQRLLYLACTRAKHYLALHWHDRQSPILQRISTKGVKGVKQIRGRRGRR